MLTAIGRGFQRRGYNGIGVDQLAHEAGLTSGAFYGHFASKSEAFKEVLLASLDEFCRTVETFQSRYGDQWIGAFVDYSLLEMRNCDMSEICAMQGLLTDVVRAGNEFAAPYQDKMHQIVDQLAQGIAGGSQHSRRRQAWGLLSVLLGAAGLARAVSETSASSEIARAARACALAALSEF